ncbi:hypothetical protein [Hyphomonas sp.]|uniref:hypothetical protein n=1 Tax=Hyphomonas sp. TaxID=87 RepID=UPI00391C0A85
MPSPPALSPLIAALITNLIASARETLAEFAPGAMPVAMRKRFVRWMIEPAEAMLRRWIWMLAADLPAPALAPAPAPSAARSAPSGRPTTRKAATARPARFRLMEPVPQRRPQTPPSHQPKAKSAAPRASDPHAAEQRLHRRLDALIRAHADPAAEARRLAALAARRAKLTLNLDFAAVPGAKSPVMAGHVREEIKALNAAAGSAYARLRRPPTPPADTS